MHRLRTASQKYSIVFALLTLVIWTVLLLGISMLLPYPLLRWDPYLPQLLLDTLLAAGGIGMLSLLGNLSILRFSGKQFGKRLLVGGYFLLIGVSSLIQNLASADRGTIRSPGHLLLFVLSMLMIGVAEEITFRGVIATLLFRQYGKTTSGVWFCVIASGILFGCPHLINAIGGGSAFTGVLVQAVSAVGSGMVFTAMYYRTRTIWVPILLHAWIDFAGLIVSGLYGEGTIGTVISSYSLWQMVSVLPYLIIAAYLLRDTKMQEILQTTKSDSALSSTI